MSFLVQDQQRLLGLHSLHEFAAELLRLFNRRSWYSRRLKYLASSIMARKGHQNMSQTPTAEARKRKANCVFVKPTCVCMRMRSLVTICLILVILSLCIQVFFFFYWEEKKRGSMACCITCIVYCYYHYFDIRGTWILCKHYHFVALIIFSYSRKYCCRNIDNRRTNTGLLLWLKTV